MRRMRIELADLATYDNLALAAYKAARGKRLRPAVQAFFSSFDASLARLRDDLLAGRLPYGQYHRFLIHDPKERLIHAACFPDRILHHAILNLAEPVFERSLVPSTFACRPGFGVHRAIERVQQALRRHAWFGQVDVNAYFPSIDHAILARLLARRFKGSDFLALLERIIAVCPAAPGCGLPIGALTSQHFANYYLDGADRFLLGHPQVRAHVRYMDDIVWWGDDRDSVRQVTDELRTWLHDARRLQLKAGVQIGRSAQGLTYCGARILRGARRLTRRKQTRYRQGCARLEAAWDQGEIDAAALQRGYAAVLAPTRHSDSRSWRQRHLLLHPSRYSDA